MSDNATLYCGIQLHDVVNMTGDAGRNLIKKLLRQAIEHSNDVHVKEFLVDRDKFKQVTDKAITEAIDFTARDQLHHILNCIVELELFLTDGWELELNPVAKRGQSFCRNQITEWLNCYKNWDDCKFKTRGKGRSLGWAKSCPDREVINEVSQKLYEQCVYGEDEHEFSRNNTSTTGASPMETTKSYSVADVAKLLIAVADEYEIGHDEAGLTPVAESILGQMADSVDDTITPKGLVSAALVIKDNVEFSPEDLAVALKMASGLDLPVGNSKPEPTTASASTVKTDIVDNSMLPAVNALLGQVMGDGTTTLNALLWEIDMSREEVANLKNELATASAAPPAHVPTSGTDVIDGGSLTFKVVTKQASDLFLAPDGSKVDVLNFGLQCLDWYDDAGNKVNHPDCPVVDPNYQFRLAHLLKSLSAFTHSGNVWAHGHTSSGKTTLFEQIAARMGYPIEVLNLDGQLERADMVGHTEIVVEDGAPTTVFREGILPRAMQKPCMFILDEIDAGRPDVLFVVQRALEGKGLAVTEDGGRHVKPHPLFRFCATANSRGQGDEHGWYQGVRPMNLSLLNRFQAFIEVQYLDLDDELRLLKQKFPKLKTKTAQQMAQFCKEIQKAFTSGELSTTLAPRNLHAMAQYYLFFTVNGMDEGRAMQESLEMCIIDGCPADNQQRIKEIAARVIPTVASSMATV